MCGRGDEWLNGIVLHKGEKEASFHPNTAGHREVGADLARRVIEDFTPSPVSDADLLNAVLPANPCGPEIKTTARQLRAGKAESGSVNNNPGDYVGIALTARATVDLNADNIDDGVIAYQCSYGAGNGHSQVASYIGGRTHAATVPFDSGLEAQPFGPVIRKLTATDDHRLRMELEAWGDYDAHAGGRVDIVQHLKFDEGKWLVQDRVVSSPEVLTQQLEHALNTGDEATLRRLATDEGRGQLRLIPLPTLSEDTPNHCTAAVPGGDPGCLVTGNDGASYNVVWTHLGWQDWRVVSVDFAGGGM